MRVRIRNVGEAELGRLQEIEISAGEAFRAIGMPEIADDPPPELDVLAGFQRAGRLWAAEDEAGIVAYVLVELIDGNAHIAQISVHADRARRGIGRALLDHVESWARERGLPALTLTTFRSVPWNGPYYERLGFREIDDVAPELAALVAHEAELGLDPAKRICMRRDIS
ncbi:Acetyltransferase (GNAT) domain-containing protein [Saccharopolyspora kobensis]|uniref:Acetyltransferase (GNAT) domain-containing protein n=1 Tax=Saccharopolyspora kobensis TaxID=146035 RepID=A0A1H6D1A4_9PSEU|nr:Acetyltransferase (GNAT) domain-containing protein [Saccharopolyspora kobensis]SFD06552.1 Acetyltransferase (GNAT) family protein [Saccharopolyspora kobensis]